MDHSKLPDLRNPVEVWNFLDLALQERPSFSKLALAAKAVTELAERALSESTRSGEQHFNTSYQTVLLQLHLPGDPKTETVRRWIASETYSIEERFAPKVDAFNPLSKSKFKERVDEIISEQTRTKHPMSIHLFKGSPTMEQVKLFLKHHWVRSGDFYRQLAELALQFVNIEEASVFYRNLYEEAGEEAPKQAHPILLTQLLQFLKVPQDIDYQHMNPLEMSYLNNRIRCVRHPNKAWGLAMLYAIEYVTQHSHQQIYEMLGRLKVPDEYRKFHLLHGTADEEHSRDLWDLVELYSNDGSFQHTFLRSLLKHFQVNREYFDMLWEEMKSR